VEKIVITGVLIVVLVVGLLSRLILPANVVEIKSFEIEGVSGIRLCNKTGFDTIWIEQPEAKKYIGFGKYLDNLKKQQGKAGAELMKVKIKTAAGWYDN